MIPTASQIARGLEALAEYRPSRGVRRTLGVVAILLFVGTLAGAVSHLPRLELRPSLVLVVAAGALGVFGINVTEFQVTGLLSGRPLGWTETIRKTLWATAANLLPVPGGPFVRMQAVADGTGGWSRAARSTLVPGVCWFAASFAAAGGALWALDSTILAAIAVLLGLGAVPVAWALVPAERRGAGLAAGLALLEAGFVAASTLRLVALFAALGYPVGPLPAVVLTTASVLATATGVFPGGLGLRELLAATAAPLLGVPPSLAVVVCALDRVVGLATLSVFGVAHHLLAPALDPATG